MSRFKKNMASRILAYLLSGAMIMSNMTAYASEPSDNTGGGTMKRRLILKAPTPDMRRKQRLTMHQKMQNIMKTKKMM